VDKIRLGKTNTRVDILSRKDQVDTKEDKKDIKILKDKLWKRRITIKVKIAIFRKTIGRNSEKQY